MQRVRTAARVAARAEAAAAAAAKVARATEAAARERARERMVHVSATRAMRAAASAARAAVRAEAARESVRRATMMHGAAPALALAAVCHVGPCIVWHLFDSTHLFSQAIVQIPLLKPLRIKWGHPKAKRLTLKLRGGGDTSPTGNSANLSISCISPRRRAGTMQTPSRPPDEGYMYLRGTDRRASLNVQPSYSPAILPATSAAGPACAPNAASSSSSAAEDAGTAHGNGLSMLVTAYNSSDSNSTEAEEEELQPPPPPPPPPAPPAPPPYQHPRADSTNPLWSDEVEDLDDGSPVYYNPTRTPDSVENPGSAENPLMLLDEEEDSMECALVEDESNDSADSDYDEEEGDEEDDVDEEDDSDDSDVDEDGTGARQRRKRKERNQRKYQKAKAAKRELRAESYAAKRGHIPPTQAEVADTFFETGPNATRMASKATAILTIRACAERDGKRVHSTVSDIRWFDKATALRLTSAPTDVRHPDAGTYRVQGANKANVVSFLCKVPSCLYHEEFRYRKQEKSWLCVACDPHTCTPTNLQRLQRQAYHAYEAPHLAPVLAQMASVQSSKVKVALLRQTLRPYLAQAPDDAFCRKVFKLACAQVKQPNSIGHVSACLEELKDVCGYETKLLTQGPQEQAQLLEAKARSEHARINKGRSSSQREAFEIPEELQDSISQLKAMPEGRRFYYAALLTFPWSGHFLRSFLPADGGKPYVVVSGADAGHCHGPGGGTIYLLMACDANRQTIALAWAQFADNESDGTWDKFLSFVAHTLPELDVEHLVIYRDGRDSITKALNTHLRKPRRFLCVRHGSEAANHAVPSSVKAYVQLANTRTVQHLAAKKQQCQPALLAYVNNSRIPESQRFLATFRASGGRTQATLSNTSDAHQLATVEPRHTTSFVESNMASASADGSRGMAPLEAILQTVETQTRRMMEHKAKADACTAPVPPQVAKMLTNMRTKAHQVGRTRVEQLQPGVARVYPDLTTGNAHYICNLQTRTCACGLTDLTDGFPCQCLVTSALAAGVVVESLVPPADCTPQWQRQYAFNFTHCLCSSASVFERAGDDLHMPVALPRPAGRPRTSRVHGSLERAAGRRPAGAELPSARRQYICKKCGQPKRGHTCTGVRTSGSQG